MLNIKLNTFEIGVFVVYILAVIAVGFYSGRKGKSSTSHFFLAGRKLPWFVIGFSLIASSISTEQFLGEVGFAYDHGLAVANWEWLVWPAQGILLFFFLPIYLKSRIYTVPEYLGRRFGELSATAFATVCIVMYLVVNLPMVLYSGGYLLEQIFGIHWFIAVVILIVAAGSYTIFGGLSAVAWVDLFNGILLIAGGFFVFVLGVKEVGLSQIIGPPESDRAHLLLPATNEHLPWTGMLALALVTNVFYYSTNQFITQRCLGARTQWDGKMGIVAAGLLAIPLALSVAWPGMIAHAMNDSLPDGDLAYPFLIKNLVPVGFRGLVFAALVGAIMSTIDSLVNSTSSLLTMDVFRKYIKKDATDRQLVKFAQIIGFAILAFAAAWTIMVKQFGGIFDYVQQCWALMMAPCAAVFLLAIFWKRATNAAAVATLALAIPMLALVFVREFLPQTVGPIADINIFNLGGLVFLFSVIFMVVVSLATKPVAPQKLKATIWKQEMLRLPENEKKKGYPWWQWIGFWFTIVGVLFLIIYIILA